MTLFKKYPLKQREKMVKLTKISDIIRNRVEESGERYFSNDNIASFIKEGELELLQKEIEEKFQEVLKSLVIDVKNDHNTTETAKRVAKMYIQEIFNGRYTNKPKVTDFPNAKQYDELYITGPIAIRSVCAHHFQNIAGNAYIGLMPGNKVIGLSKFSRLVEHICSRPQIQEEMTQQIADAIEKETNPKGLAVIVKAEHHCMLARGVKAHETEMSTSIFRGVLRDSYQTKAEFLSLLQGSKGYKN